MRRTLALATCLAATLGLAACGHEISGSGAPLQAPSAAQVKLGGSEWPRFLGPNGNGISPETGINKDWKARPPRKLWEAALGDDGYAGPSVAGGKLFIIDHSGDKDIVKALDMASGKTVWEYTYADNASPNYGFARSTPSVSAGKVYTFSRLGILNCLNAADGKPVWTRNLATDYSIQMPSWQMSGSPLIDGDRVVVCTGGPNALLVALDKATGKTIWAGGGSDKPGYATPVAATIGGVKQYVVFGGTSLVGVSASDGKALWSTPWKTSYDVNAATPIVAGDAIYISSGYGHGSQVVDIANGQATVRWMNNTMPSRFSTPVLYKGSVYGTGEPGNLLCINPTNGSAAWKQSGFEWGGIVIVDGAIIAMNGSNGDVVMVEASPSAYKEMGRFNPLGGQSWTAPIVANGRLILRNKGKIACFDLK